MYLFTSHSSFEQKHCFSATPDFLMSADDITKDWTVIAPESLAKSTGTAKLVEKFTQWLGQLFISNLLTYSHQACFCFR